MLKKEQLGTAIEITGVLRKTTAKAILVMTHGREIWFPRSQSETRGGGRFYVAGWLAERELLQGTPVSPAAALAEGAQVDRVIGIGRIVRHIDCILGDLSGVMERIQENGSTPQLDELRRRLTLEAAIAETDGTAGMSGPYVAPGYMIDPDFNAAEHYDGETEIAAEQWHVDPALPGSQFWHAITVKMIEAGHARAIRRA